MKKLNLRIIIRSLDKNKSINIHAQGQSMYPLIKNNQRITILTKRFSQIKVSDIVVYQLKDKIIIHQCLFKNKRYLVCFGLNNKFIDPPIYPNQILGIVKVPNYWQIVGLVYQTEVKKIKKLLPALKLLILKGPLWQQRFYGHQTNFPLSDIDILIKKVDYPTLKTTLIKLGYQTKHGLHIKLDRYNSNIPQVSEISFYKKINGIHIELDIHLQAVRSALHEFNCQPICQKNMDNLTKILWQSSKRVDDLYFLQNEYLLLYLCLNLFFHHGTRDIKLLSYVAMSIDKQSINWANFYKLCQKYSMVNFVYYPLFYSSLFFQINVPDLNRYKPAFGKKILLKIFINKHLVFYPLNCSKSTANWLNTRLILIERLILNL